VLSSVLFIVDSVGLDAPAQNLFNGMLMKGRSLVVEAIGLFKGRWKLLEDLNMWVLIMCHKPLLLVVYCMTCAKFQGSLNQSFARTLRRMEGASKGA
jgi:hypothetical protein